MYKLSNDIKYQLLLKSYLNDIDALNLFKTCKSHYVKINVYKYKCCVSCENLNNYKNCIVTQVKNIIQVSQLQGLSNFITHLTFGNFNGLLEILPKSIIHLTLGSNFNQRVDNLPNSITHLKFGWDFNQPVDNLPNSITHLSFGYRFNQPVTKLPNSIKCLKFGMEFNQPVCNLPNSITLLELTSYYFHQL